MTSRSVEFRTSRKAHAVGGEVIFSAMRAAHQKALDARPTDALTANFILAGVTVHTRIVGKDLARSICRPFRHLRTVEDVGRSHLSIDLWDEHITGVACPQGVREMEEEARTRREGDSFLTVGTAQDLYVGHLRPGIHVWMDRETAHVIGWVANAAQLQVQDRGKPLYFPLLLWHADRGIPVIHAALVSYRGQGVLLIGKGGTGKTTAALACLFGGLNFLGDDYIGLQRTGNDLFIGHSLYDSAWLTADGEARFPHLVPYAEPPECLDSGGRPLVQVFDVAPDRLESSARIHAVVVTTLSDKEPSQIHRVSKATALLALAPSSMLRLPVSGEVLLERISQLVEHVPSYQLAIGRDLASLPLLVRELLEAGKDQ